MIGHLFECKIYAWNAYTSAFAYPKQITNAWILDKKRICIAGNDHSLWLGN